MIIDEIRGDLNEIQDVIKDQKISEDTKSIFLRISNRLDLIEEMIKELKRDY